MITKFVPLPLSGVQKIAQVIIKEYGDEEYDRISAIENNIAKRGYVSKTVKGVKVVMALFTKEEINWFKDKYEGVF